LNIEALSQLLREAEEHHGEFEAVAPPHEWPDWYAAYMTPASAEATRRRPPPPPGATWRRSNA
jgi:hypothetical protein